MSSGEQLGPDADIKGHSCLACRQRKVKCDRHSPCANCVKAARQCSFIPPIRGKRKKTKAPKEGLHAKLRRYEELLKSHGAIVEPSEYDGDSDSEMASQPDTDVAEDASVHSKPGAGSFALGQMKPTLIDKEGSSRYLDRYALSISTPDWEITKPFKVSFVQLGRRGKSEPNPLLASFLSGYAPNGLLDPLVVSLSRR